MSTAYHFYDDIVDDFASRYYESRSGWPDSTSRVDPATNANAREAIRRSVRHLREVLQERWLPDDIGRRLMPFKRSLWTENHEPRDALWARYQVFIERSRRAAETPGCTDFPLGVFDRESGRYVGGTGFHRIKPGQREAEVGYWIRGDAQGQGLCTEAVGALITAGLTPADRGGWGLRRIVIFNAAPNLASRRVCQKLGLRLEQRCRQEKYQGALPGQAPLGYLDTYGFAVLQDEWDFARQRARGGIDWDTLSR